MENSHEAADAIRRAGRTRTGALPRLDLPRRCRTWPCRTVPETTSPSTGSSPAKSVNVHLSRNSESGARRFWMTNEHHSWRVMSSLVSTSATVNESPS